MTQGILMDDIENARMDHRHGEAWGQVGSPDYPCFVGKSERRKLWPVALVVVLVPAPALIAWLVLR